METTVCLHLAKVLCLLNKAASFSCYLAKLKIKTDKTNWDKCEMITFPRLHVKLYIPSNIKTILMLWHTKTKEKDTLAKLQKFSALPKGPNQPRDGKSTRFIIFPLKIMSANIKFYGISRWGNYSMSWSKSQSWN